MKVRSSVKKLCEGCKVCLFVVLGEYWWFESLVGFGADWCVSFSGGRV